MEKEENIKLRVSQELQQSLDSSFSKLNGHVIVIEQELSAQKQQIDSVKTKLISESLTKVTELFQSIVASRQETGPSNPVPISSLAAPTNPAIGLCEAIGFFIFEHSTKFF